MVNFVAKVIANGQHVQGECMEVSFDNWIEVLAYDWGGERGQVSHAGAGRQGRVTYANLVLRKRADAASPLLFKALDNNELCEVTLQLRKTGTGGQLENYMKITLKSALVVQIKQGNLQFGGEISEEEVSFSYQEIEMEYDAQDPNTGITRGGIMHSSRMFQS
ncbi:MAG: type VI secretion system tube protein Hcp [Bryobacterales bacterium]|nr:type VI secretion system tube protein Hcp [Bryobacterales bacterium]